MHYDAVTEGRFLDRPNRFIAHVEINGEVEVCHVKNTGRCRELLIPGVKVYLAKGKNPLRKTRYDLIAVEKIRQGKTPLLINMDSQAPNDAAEEFLRKGTLFPPGSTLRREVTHRSSRFDFQITSPEGQITFLEVKGVTLEQQGAALFPDAPTLRGVRHLQELARCGEEGFRAAVLFVIQMKEIRCFRPHDAMHPEFGMALRQAQQAGVRLYALDCRVTPRSMEIDTPVRIDLDPATE